MYIIKMLYKTFLTIIALIFGIHFYKNQYPSDFDLIISQISDGLQKNKTLNPYLPLVSTLLYNAIYVYSLFQVGLNKTIQFCIPYIQEGSKRVTGLMSKSTPPIITTNKLITNSLVTSEYDLVLIKSFTNDMIILDKVPDNLHNIKYEISDIRFLALYLKNKEQTYIIDLFNKDINYYVVDNIFDSKFFKYYLKNVLNISMDNDKLFSYTLELMDQNVSMVYLNETQSIVIKKDGYSITNQTEDKKETEEQKETEKELEEDVQNEIEKELEEESEPKVIIEKSFDTECIYY